MKTRILILTLLIAHLSFTQTRTCLSNEKTNEMMFNPLMKQKHLEQIEKSNQELLKIESGFLQKSPQSTLYIPVAVHFTQENNSNRACLVALAQNQIDILNNDFNATNSDISTWNNSTSPFFPGVNNGSIDIELVLATQNHPANTDPNLVNGQPAVTIGYNFAGSSDWNTTWAGYLNIVVDDAGGNLGYAYLASSPASGSAIFINFGAFASGSGCGNVVPSAPYNLGRTLTHELGHYLNLRHIWGNGVCGDDLVSDTPQHNEDNGGCPPINHYSTCPSTQRELTMNYMDYTNDSCMYMFTLGQTNRMQAHLNTIADDFNQNTLDTGTFSNKVNVNLYPNPTKSILNITIPSELKTSNNSYTIYNSLGQTINSNQMSDSDLSINTSEFSNGIYFIKLNFENSSKTLRFIKN